jgi:hypothetical protein
LSKGFSEQKAALSEESYQRNKKCKPLAGAPAVGIIFLAGNKLLIDRTPERNARHRGFERPAQQSQERIPVFSPSERIAQNCVLHD